MIRCTAARVDLAALEANFRAVRAYLAREAGLNRAAGAGPSAAPGIIAVVKANAYGHGAVAVARTLEAAGAAWLAVADIEEGIELREAGIRARILVFGALSVSAVDGVFAHDLTPTISSPAAARALEAAARARGARLACHLKIDTGMHRLGFRHDNLRRTLPGVLASPHLAIEAVHTHFATAEDAEHPLFEEQRVRFGEALGTLDALGARPRYRHAANSAALLRDSRVWYDLVRPGLLLYGLAPPPVATTIPLAPVMTLTSRIVAVKGLRPGESVGYGARFTTPEAATLAVVPAGYADGLDRRLEGRGAVLVRGRRAPIVGAVSMDMLTVDITGIPDVAPGDEVVFLGRQGDAAIQTIDAREVAAWIGTIPYEVLCRLGARVRRQYDGQAG
ncbi:MAG: alanine racemase [Vicinamibacterales bacterium]